VLVKATNEIVHLLQETSQSSSCKLIPLLATEGFTIPAWSEMMVPAETPAEAGITGLAQVDVEISEYDDIVMQRAVFAAGA